MNTRDLKPGTHQDTKPVGGENADGVDVSLIRWMLSLTPEERLDVLQTFVDGFDGISDGRT